MLVPPLYSKKQELTTVCESSLPEWGGKKPFSSPGTGEKMEENQYKQILLKQLLSSDVSLIV